MTAPIPFVDAIGKAPVFWRENAAFVANLLGLFFGNEEETRMLEEEVGEVDSYGGRLLPIMNFLYAGDGHNLLVLEREPVAALARYFADALGLKLPRVVILPHSDYVRLGDVLNETCKQQAPLLDELRALGARRLDGYVTDTTLTALAQAVDMQTFSTVEGSRLGNNKWLLFRRLSDAGLPTPPTAIAACGEELPRCLVRIRDQGYNNAVIRAPLGASGVGMVKVDAQTPAEQTPSLVPDHFFTDGPCLVQGWLEQGSKGINRLHSPSAQIFVADDRVMLYDLTEQILSLHSIHEGNVSPPPYLKKRPHWREEIIRQTDITGRWLHQQGYRGTASADFILAELEGDRCELYVCEINARVTGATYPSVLARNFHPQGSWLMQNLRFKQPASADEILSRLATSGALFTSERKEQAVIPINLNLGDDSLVHKGQFLFIAPSFSQCLAVREKARQTLDCMRDRN